MIYIDDSEPDGVLEPAFPYRDVTIKRGVDANELYEILSEVGRGKFGTVYRCQEKSTGLKLAAKFVPIPKREDKRNVEREVEIMNSLQHHLIIQLYAAYEYQKMMCVVLELVEGGELFDRVVDDDFVLTERVGVVFIRQVCEAMEFIHRNNILHLDLKPENILCLTQEGNRIKIIDFGLARKFDPDKRLQILFGTPEFVAPEVVNFDCISYGTDMWSVGVICYVLISGLSPFMGETDIETMANVTIAKYDFEDDSFSNVSPECIDFISKLLVKDLSTRMTAAQCLEHKWLQRKPKAPPIVSPKPLNVPPPKLKADTPSPIPPQDESEDDDSAKLLNNVNEQDDEEEEPVKELDTTKGNLKHFIERWEEHPNSPYVFDVEANVIAPLSETPYKNATGPDSISSSRVCSPSPCESFDTITDDEQLLPDMDNESTHTPATPINESREKIFPGTPGAGASSSPSEAATPTPQLPIQYASQHLFGRPIDDNLSASSSDLQQRSMKSYLHTFDRRNSDTNYILGRRTSVGERVNLAEEIRKLSDHLLMLAEINTKLGNEAKRQAENDKNDRNNNNTSHESSQTHAFSSASKSSNSKTYTSSTSSSSSTYSSFERSSSIAGKAKHGNLALRLQQTIEETPTLTNGSTSFQSSSSNQKSSISTVTTGNIKTTSSSSTERSLHSTTNAMSSSTASGTNTSNESASYKRHKFRISAMSRDVPIGLPDTHQTVNLEEAANTTKDCLLHLLEKYNDTKTRNPLGRHQSISVDWNMSDNLEYRSMSSINAFFQRHNNNGQHVRQLQAQLEEKSKTESGKRAET